jgi:hypothetical protein
VKTLQIRFIPHTRQRYDTCGDYQGSLFSISVLPDWRYMILVAVHEIIEWAICKQYGISERDIDRFDLAWAGDGEPGDALDAPYHDAHVIATNLEQQLSAALGVDWDAYGQAIDRLDWK